VSIEQPIISLALLHQVGGIPGAPGAGPPLRSISEAVIALRTVSWMPIVYQCAAEVDAVLTR
jgi:hypothetical protein